MSACMNCWHHWGRDSGCPFGEEISSVWRNNFIEAGFHKLKSSFGWNVSSWVRTWAGTQQLSQGYDQCIPSFLLPFLLSFAQGKKRLIICIFLLSEMGGGKWSLHFFNPPFFCCLCHPQCANHGPVLESWSGWHTLNTAVWDSMCAVRWTYSIRKGTACAFQLKGWERRGRLQEGLPSKLAGEIQPWHLYRQGFQVPNLLV